MGGNGGTGGGGGGGGFGGQSQSANASNNRQGSFSVSGNMNGFAPAAAEGTAEGTGEGYSDGTAEGYGAFGGVTSPGDASGYTGYSEHQSDRAVEAANERAFDRAERAHAFGLSGKTEGGFFDGGPLGGVLSGLNTLASFAVPGYAPIGMGVSLANNAIGATNSLGMTDTGQFGPGIGDAASDLSASLGVPSSAAADPNGMLGGLNVDQGKDALTQALAQQQSGPLATNPATTSTQPVTPGVPDPRSLAGIMAAHYPGRKLG